MFFQALIGFGDYLKDFPTLKEIGYCWAFTDVYPLGTDLDIKLVVLVKIRWHHICEKWLFL